MELQLTENLKLETDLPLREAAKFQFSWIPCRHAQLNLEGYLDGGIPWEPGQSETNRLKLWLEEDGEKQVIYNGIIEEVKIRRIGGSKQVRVKAASASCLLDRHPDSRSFQDPSKTYGEMARQAVCAEGGEVIRNRETDKEAVSPVIQYEETAWEFANRQGGRLGVPIIPDIETGEPNLWFGMRNGKGVTALSDAQCKVQIRPLGKNRGMLLQAEGMEFYKIGDRMSYMGQKTVITGVEGRYEHGELVFLYTLKDKAKRHQEKTSGHSAGLGLWGTVTEVKGDKLRMNLDLDGGKSTGEYFYPWYPDTGNGIYAMPEKGTRVLLYFFGADEQDGAAIHCMNQNPERDRLYESRAFHLADGNSVRLEGEAIDVSRREGHKVTLDDNSVLASSPENLTIKAEGKIKLKGRRISISSPDELNICQG